MKILKPYGEEFPRPHLHWYAYALLYAIYIFASETWIKNKKNNKEQHQTSAYWIVHMRCGASSQYTQTQNKYKQHGANTNAYEYTRTHTRALRIHINKYAPQQHKARLVAWRAWPRPRHRTIKPSYSCTICSHIQFILFFAPQSTRSVSLSYRGTDIYNQHEHIEKPCGRIPRALVVNCINLCTAHTCIYNTPYALYSYSQYSIRTHGMRV